MTKTQRRTAGLAAAAAIGLAGCSGSSSPHVASLGNGTGNGSGVTTTALPTGNPTQLLDEWATCMRSNGDPNQVDPTIDANKVIHITFPANTSGNGPVAFGKGSNNPCDNYLQAASTALRGGKPPQKPDPAKLEKFAQCMRSNGIPDFPDPSAGGGLRIQSSPGSDLNPNNPTFKNASKLCSTKYGLPGLGTGTPQPGSIEASSGGLQGGPGGNGGSGTNSGGGEVIGG